MAKTISFGGHGAVTVQEALEIMIEKQFEFKHYVRGKIEETNLSDSNLPLYISLLQEADKSILSSISEINKIHSS